MAKATVNANGTAQSKPQNRSAAGGNVFGGTSVGIGVRDLGLAGYSAPSPGTYETYRRMRLDPTVALARAVALGPLKAAQWSVEAEDGAPDAAVDLVARTLMPMMPEFMRDMSYGVDYGWAPFEKVWKIVGGEVRLAALKPLLVDSTLIRVNEQTGQFAGVSNLGVELGERYAFVYTHDRECGDYYGRSRHENIRETAWRPWIDTLEKVGTYVRKAAGVTVIVRYPVGSEEINGQRQDNADIAMDLLRNLKRGDGISMPQIMASWAQNLVDSGVRPDDVAAWKIDFLEPKTDHSAGFVSLLRYYDSLKLRGWLVPERVAIEGQHGTLAESSAHADVALLIAEDTLNDMGRQINTGIVDDLLAINFGEGMRGAVRMEPQPLADDDKAFFRSLMTAVVTNPGAYDTAAMILDVDAMLDATGLPKSEQVVDIADGQDPMMGLPDVAPSQPVTQAVSQTALNGIQITSLRELIEAVSRKQLTSQIAKDIAAISFPGSDQALIERAINNAAKFTPAPAVAASRWKSARFGSAVMGRSAAEMLRRAQKAATRFGEVRGTLGP